MVSLGKSFKRTFAIVNGLIAAIASVSNFLSSPAAAQDIEKLDYAANVYAPGLLRTGARERDLVLEEFEAGLADAKRAGFNRVVTDLHLGDVSRERGAFLETMMQTAKNAGIKLTVKLHYPGKKAGVGSKSKEGTMSYGLNPRYNDAYASVVTFLAENHADVIDGIQILHEPDNKQFGGGKPMKAIDFADLMHAVHRAMDRTGLTGSVKIIHPAVSDRYLKALKRAHKQLRHDYPEYDRDYNHTYDQINVKQGLVFYPQSLKNAIRSARTIRRLGLAPEGGRVCADSVGHVVRSDFQTDWNQYAVSPTRAANITVTSIERLKDNGVRCGSIGQHVPAKQLYIGAVGDANLFDENGKARPVVVKLRSLLGSGQGGWMSPHFK